MKALRELLERLPRCFELNMGLSIIQGFTQRPGKLSKRIESKIETDDFEGEKVYGLRANERLDGNGKRPKG